MDIETIYLLWLPERTSRFLTRGRERLACPKAKRDGRIRALVYKNVGVNGPDHVDSGPRIFIYNEKYCRFRLVSLLGYWGSDVRWFRTLEVLLMNFGCGNVEVAYWKRGQRSWFRGMEIDID